MKQEINALDGILDIVMPIAPADTGWSLYGIMLVILLLALASIVAIYSWWKSPRQRSRRELARVLAEYRTGTINARDSAFRLAATLRTHVCQSHVSANTALPARLKEHRKRWKTFIHQLDIARYSGDNVKDTELHTLANETQFWLSKW